MKWTIVIMWFVNGSNFEVPSLGHSYYWFNTEAECEQHLLNQLKYSKEYKVYRDANGLVLEGPWIQGTQYQRCNLFALPE